MTHIARFFFATSKMPRIHAMCVMSLVYRTGNKMHVAENLCGLSCIQWDKIPLDLHVDHTAFSDTQLAKVCKETKSCQLLLTVYRLMHNGWPATCRQIPQVVYKYWDMCEELMSDNCLLLKGSWVIMPTALNESFLHKLHEEHAEAPPSASFQPNGSSAGLAWTET